jgi:uncharacterized protein (TIGR02246 family)
MRFLGPGILALVVALSAVPAAARQATDADVDKIVQAFMAAYNKADAATLASFYTDDATRVTPDGGVHTGKAAIQKSFADAFAGPMRGAMIKITTSQVRQINPDVRIAVGTWETTGGAGGPASGKYINTVVRQGGTWKIAASGVIRPSI